MLLLRNTTIICDYEPYELKTSVDFKNSHSCRYVCTKYVLIWFPKHEECQRFEKDITSANNYDSNQDFEAALTVIPRLFKKTIQFKSSIDAWKMSTSQVIHHIDYRSKAKERKKELEKLQEKGLTKTKGKLIEYWMLE